MAGGGKKKKARIVVALVCKECGTQTYVTSINKQNNHPKELNKFCPHCRKHTPHKIKEKLK